MLDELTYTEEFVSLLRRMLSISEDQRPDFIELN
jgi:hypothetical protein